MSRLSTYDSKSSVAMSLDERTSFHELYAAHAHGVYTTALAILKNVDAAHDVAHDVFLRAWQYAGQYDPSRGSPGVWLRAVTRNLSIDRLRADRRLSSPNESAGEGSTPPDGCLPELLTHEQMERARRAFDMLPPMHRQLIEMSYDQEMSHADIAEKLQQPLGTIKSRIRQAHAMLRTFASQAALAVEPRHSWLDPVSEAFTTINAEPSPEARSQQLSGLRVLVVDDDVETVKLVSAVLNKFSVRPAVRTSAREGLAAMRESWPDVLISDLNMPDEDGYALIRQAKAMALEGGHTLRAAAFTSWSGEQERSRALVAGFDLYINKPVHPLALIAAVARLSQ